MTEQEPNENMELWNSWRTVPTEHTKKVDHGRGFTAIDAYWQIQKMTERFGPAGKGWGCKTIDKGTLGPLYFMHIELWHRDDDEICVVESINAVEIKGTRRDGKEFVDADAPKKALTGAMTKAMSFLGIGADVFLGKYDDNQYVQALRAQELGATVDKQTGEVHQQAQAGLVDNLRNPAPQAAHQGVTPDIGGGLPPWVMEPVGVGKKCPNLSWVEAAKQEGGYVKWLAGNWKEDAVRMKAQYVLENLVRGEGPPQQQQPQTVPDTGPDFMEAPASDMGWGAADDDGGAF